MLIFMQIDFSLYSKFKVAINPLLGVLKYIIRVLN